MSAVTDAIYATIVADSQVTDQLTLFNGRSAIFSYRPVPESAVAPYVFIGEARRDQHDDTLTSTGRVIVHPVWLIFPRSGGVGTLDQTAERIRTLFHRQSSIVVSGFSTVQVIAEGPRLGTLEDEGGSENQRVAEVARIVDVMFTLCEP